MSMEILESDEPIPYIADNPNSSMIKTSVKLHEKQNQKAYLLPWHFLLMDYKYDQKEFLKRKGSFIKFH